jgi:tetratricopeptide (TPR) repeat protein
LPDESHGSGALAGASDSLRQVFVGYVVPQAVSDGGLAAVETYYAAWSARIGWRTSVPSHVLSELALDALQNGHAPEAIKLLERNIRDDPNAPDAYDSLAEAYQKTGDLAAALAAEQKARALAAKFDASNLVYYNQQLARIRHKQAALIAPLK